MADKLMDEQLEGGMGDCNIHKEKALVSQGNPWADRTGACRSAYRHVILWTHSDLLFTFQGKGTEN